MRLLVTGATGLLGTELLQALAPHHTLLGWARRQSPAASPCRLASVDVADQKAVLTKMKEFSPDGVIHTAAMSDVDACERDPQAAHRYNRDAVENVAHACQVTGAFLIAVSTDYVFDGSSSGAPYREEDPPHPINVYGESKLAGEKAALSIAPRSAVVRVSGLFGLARSNFVTEALSSFRSGRPVKTVKDQVYSPSYTEDVALGLYKLVERFEKRAEVAGLLHLANAGGCSRLELAQEIARLLNVSNPLIEMTTWKDLARPARRPLRSVLDCGKFAALVGSPLRPWRQALQAFVATRALASAG